MQEGLAKFAKKSLGQNFLKSEKALSDIVQAGDIQPNDTIIEIGPGEGALTKRILDMKPKKLIIVEKDDRLIPILEEKFRESIDSGVLNIIHGDIIELLEGEFGDNVDNKGIKLSSPYKVIANIPYYITGLIIRRIFEQKVLPSKIVLLVQKEVADRIVARGENGKMAEGDTQNGAKESLLSLSVKIYGTPKRVSVVPKGAFVPAPTVDSAVILINDIARKIPQDKETAFFELLHAAFSHKRKRLAKNLSSFKTPNVTGSAADSTLSQTVIDQALEDLKIDKNTRAEDLSVEKYIQLLNRLI